jgi:hypothetical protein
MNLLGKLTVFAFVAVLAVAFVLSRPEAASPDAHGAPGPLPAAEGPALAAVGPTPKAGASAVPVTPDDAGPTKNPALDGPVACGVYTSQDLRMASATTVEGLSEWSDAVIVGTVASVSEGRIASRDGMPPVEDELIALPPEVYRVATVRVSAIGKAGTVEGDRILAPGTTINVRVLGGTIGCRTYQSSSDLPFDIGGDVVLFLGTQSVLSGAPPEDFDVIDLWPIRDGVVEGREGRMTPEALLLTSATP